MYADNNGPRIWPISLPQIEATVSEYLGPGRVPGNKPEPCFSRHISMYLAKHVGGWSTPKIGRFYNARHHTTVLAAIRKIDRLRNSDESVNALLEVLTATLTPEVNQRLSRDVETKWRRLIIDAVADRVLDSFSNAHRPADILQEGRA